MRLRAVGEERPRRVAQAVYAMAPERHLARGVRLGERAAGNQRVPHLVGRESVLEHQLVRRLALPLRLAVHAADVVAVHVPDGLLAGGVPLPVLRIYQRPGSLAVVAARHVRRDPVAERPVGHLLDAADLHDAGRGRRPELHDLLAGDRRVLPLVAAAVAGGDLCGGAACPGRARAPVLAAAVAAWREPLRVAGYRRPVAAARHVIVIPAGCLVGHLPVLPRASVPQKSCRRREGAGRRAGAVSRFGRQGRPPG